MAHDWNNDVAVFFVGVAKTESKDEERGPMLPSGVAVHGGECG